MTFSDEGTKNYFSKNHKVTNKKNIEILKKDKLLVQFSDGKITAEVNTLDYDNI